MRRLEIVRQTEGGPVLLWGNLIAAFAMASAAAMLGVLGFYAVTGFFSPLAVLLAFAGVVCALGGHIVSHWRKLKNGQPADARDSG